MIGNKLQIVRKSLESNPDVAIVHCIKPHERELFPFYQHTPQAHLEIKYLTAPKKGLYDCEELQNFMAGLIPGLRPDKIDNFYKFGKKWMTWKWMAFGAKFFVDNEIGKEEIRHKAIFWPADNELSDIINGLEKEKVEEKKISMEIGVYVFPNEEIAKNYIDLSTNLERMYRHGSLRELKKYQPKKSFLERVLGKLVL